METIGTWWMWAGFLAIVPVSYTHLDVYKRQVTNGSSAISKRPGASIERLNTCLPTNRSPNVARHGPG